MAVSQMSPEPMFINGEWTEGSSGKRIPVYDPSTEDVIAEIPDASAADVDAAVAAARYAFDEGGWPQTTAQDRGRILFQMCIRDSGLQVLPLLAWWIARRRSPPAARTQRNLIFAMAASYLALFLLLLWQAFRGQSIARPDKLTLEGFAVWLFATGVAVIAIKGKTRNSSYAAHQYTQR